MKINLKVQGLAKVQTALRKLSRVTMEEAAISAINDTAFQLRKDMQDEMREVFDRPTPYMLRSVKVVKAAPGDLRATIAPTYMGGKGTDPQNVLHAQAFGGERRLKRSERALQASGVLPTHLFTALPKDPYPGSDDGRGNLRGPFAVRLLSYFNSFGEQGYSANMSDKRRKKLHNEGTSSSGYKSINGVKFFATYGMLRSGPGGHLPAGIWAKSGTHGVNVRPVLMFVRSPSYQVRFDLQAVLQRTDAQTKFETRLRYRLRLAAGM